MSPPIVAMLNTLNQLDESSDPSEAILAKKIKLSELTSKHALKRAEILAQIEKEDGVAAMDMGGSAAGGGGGAPADPR